MQRVLVEDDRAAERRCAGRWLPDLLEKGAREIGPGGRIAAGAGNRKQQAVVGNDRGGDRHVVLAQRDRIGQRDTAQDVALTIGDDEARAGRGLLGEHALRTGAAGGVGGIGTERVHRDPQGRHVADEFDRDRTRALVRGNPQSRARLGIGEAGGLQGREDRDQRQRQERGADDQEQLGTSRHATQRRDEPAFGHGVCL